MNIKDDDRVSAVALVVESDDNSAPTDDDPSAQAELEEGVEAEAASSDDNGASPDVPEDESSPLVTQSQRAQVDGPKTSPIAVLFGPSTGAHQHRTVSLAFNEPQDVGGVRKRRVKGF